MRELAGTTYELEIIESELDDLIGSVAFYSIEEALSFRQSLRRSSCSSGSSFVECGNALRSFGVIARAMECYGDAIRVEPGCLAAYLARGELFFELAVCAAIEEETARYGKNAVSDLRAAMLLSLGASDVIWRLGCALLLIGDVAAARGLAEKVISGSEGGDRGPLTDFLFLLEFSKLFLGDWRDAVETFELLGRVDGAVAESIFGEFVVSLVCGKAECADEALGRLIDEDGKLYQAGMCLKESGCGSFLDVARALIGFRMRNGAGCEVH